jgi:SAM-dependent methyltransferase
MTGPLEQGVLGTRRSALLAGLPGEVLDIGVGTGANLPHFRSASRVVAAEPDPAMRRRMAAKLPGTPVPVELTGDAAQALRHPDASFDAVVFTLVLCTVTDPGRALAETRRVLRPGGRLIILEHVRGSGSLARWQDRLTPAATPPWPSSGPDSRSSAPRSSTLPRVRCAEGGPSSAGLSSMSPPTARNTIRPRAQYS